MRLLICLLALFIFPLQAKVIHSKHLNFKIEEVCSGLDHPWSVAFINQAQALITERSGKLLKLNLDNCSRDQIQGLPLIASGGQGGLLDVILDPDFATNRVIFFSYAAGRFNKGTQVARAKLQNNQLSELKVIFVAEPKVMGGRHFGSRLVRQGEYLFISLGDRGNRQDAQRLNNHLGSLIRIYPDGSIPPDNPFVNSKRAEIFSYGHRNIQGLALDNSGQLWSHEHGPQGGDELNPAKMGANFGWPVITYGANYGTGTKIGEGTHKQGMEQPVHYWDPSIAPSGMAWYSGRTLRKWQGDLFVGSLKFGQLVRLRLKQNQVIEEERLLDGAFGRIRDVRTGPDQLLYLLTDSDNGQLLRLSPAD